MTSKSNLQNIASERAVLAGVCQFGEDAWLDVDGLVEESTFTLEVNRVIFACIKHAIKTNAKIDFSTILSSAQTLSLGEFINEKENLKHLNGILSASIKIENVRKHAQKIRRLQFSRTIQNKLRDIYRALDATSGEETINKILSLVEKPIEDICLSYIKEDESAPKKIGESIDEYLEHVENNKGKSLGIPSGYPSYDVAIGGGFRRKCVDLISARPKVGKSCIADNIALHISSKLNIPVLMLDTEMSTEDHWNRLLANLSGVEINTIANGGFAKNFEDRDKVVAAAKVLKKIPYHYISIAGKPFEETLSIARRWLMKHVGYDENGKLKDCLIIYDYLKLMTSESISNNLAEFQVLGFQITSLHNFCVENDCACLSFVQLNRDGITKESTDAVSGSDRLIWLCTSFSIFKAKTDEERAQDGLQNGNRKLIPLVARHGPGIDDGGYICLQMDGSTANIREIGLIREIKKNEKTRSKGFSNASTSESEDEGDEENF
jgi:replicative DNA helicase